MKIQEDIKLCHQSLIYTLENLCQSVQTGFTSVHTLTFTCHNEGTLRITGREYKNNYEKEPPTLAGHTLDKSCCTSRKPIEDTILHIQLDLSICSFV